MQTVATANTSDRVLSIQQFAAKYGISRQTVYNELARGKLRSAKIGRRRIITPQHEADYLAQIEA
ncbi:helix-turn-helix domain-containing protein [Parahaliea aestuarii]|uniref:Helix-turn-helix domain-containing protein n=1 Tax=Parahaliea aestuarii TaxID=1852021 RepID=A0A5C8ZN02_9GAMM|nr:helix-turn-helix domain-containing protein [Parahaliea aestuarii]TXS89575.1 helix-turn-helix domain-containing protein [Parahaliea aestuarii]